MIIMLGPYYNLLLDLSTSDGIDFGHFPYVSGLGGTGPYNDHGWFACWLHGSLELRLRV